MKYDKYSSNKTRCIIVLSRVDAQNNKHLVALGQPEAHGDLVHHALIVWLNEVKDRDIQFADNSGIIASLYIIIQLHEHGDQHACHIA